MDIYNLCERLVNPIAAATIVIRLFNDLADFHQLYMTKGWGETSHGNKESM